MRNNTWILIANSAKAKIVEDRDGKGPMAVIREIENPDGRTNAAGLVSDRPSRPQSSTGERSALAPRIDPHRNVQQHFAHKLIDVLDAGRRNNAFGNLVIASSRPFLGILLDQCDEQLRHVLRKSIPRNLCDLPLEDVREAIDAYKSPIRVRP